MIQTQVPEYSIKDFRGEGYDIHDISTFIIPSLISNILSPNKRSM